MFKLLLSLFIFVSSGALAATDTYPFERPEQGKRFAQLTQEIRCMVCQNQNIAESNASLAIDMKNEVYAKIRTGVSDDIIKHDLRQRYGDYVLFRPTLSPQTIMLWFAPAGFLLLGIAILFVRIKKQRVVSNDSMIKNSNG